MIKRAYCFPHSQLETAKLLQIKVEGVSKRMAFEILN